MVVITGTVRIGPGALAAARPVMEAVLTASRAERGCLSYAYAVDVLDPTLIHVTEQWESEEALKAHLASDHVALWRSHWPDLGITDRRLTMHVVRESRAV